MTRLDDLRAMRDFCDREIAAELGRKLPALDRHLVSEVADLYGVTADDILGGSRQHQVARARHGLAWLLRRQGLSVRGIALALGYTDHGVINYALRKVERDPARRALLLGLEAS